MTCKPIKNNSHPHENTSMEDMLLEPITKKRLSKFLALKAQTENHLERIARMKSNEKFPTMRESGGSGHQSGASDRMANAVIKRLTYEEQISEQINANLAEMDIIRKAIDALEDPMEQEVLRLRYVDGDGFYKRMPWRDVAMRMYHDDDESKIRAVTRIHGRALENIRKVEI